VVTKKEIECVYSVSLDFDDSSVRVVTGPPGVYRMPDKQRCWRFVLGDDKSVIDFRRNNGGATNCPNSATGVDVGSITNFAKNVTDGYGGKCTNSSYDNVLPESVVGAGPEGFLTQTSITDLASTAFPLTQLCFTGPAAEVEGARGVPSYTVTTAGSNPCIKFQINTRVGALVAMPAAATCGTWSATNAFVAPMAFPNLAADGSASTSASAAPTTMLVTRPVVQYTINFTSITLSPLDAADPCHAFKIRAAAAAQIPGTPVSSVILTSLVSGSTTIALAGDSPANTATSAPACAARRLLLEAAGSPSLRSLRTDAVDDAADAEAEAAEAMFGPRALQAAAPLSIGVSTVLPPSTNGATAAQAAATALQGATPISYLNAPSTTTGVQAVAEAKVTVPVVYKARVDPYVPDPLILQFHDIPRFALGGGPTPTNQFSLSMDYIQGALYPAGGIIALAILSLLLYSLAYTCGCCACTCMPCRRKRDPAIYEQGCKKRCGPTTAFKVFAALNIALILSCIAYIPRFGNGVQTLADAIGMMADVMSSAGKIMSSPTQFLSSQGNMIKSIKDSTFDAGNNADLANTQCTSVSPNCNGAVTKILDAVKSGATTASSGAGSAGDALTDLADLLREVLNSVDIDTIKSSLSMAGFAVLGILCLNLAVFTASTCKHRLACCLYRILAPINILLITILIILTGVYYAIGIIGADLCAAPTDTILFLAGETGMAGGLPGESLSYYLTCGASPATPPAGAYKLLVDTVGTVGGAVSQLESLRDQITANPNSPAFVALNGTNYVPLMVQGMSDAKDAVQTIADTTLACSAIDPIFSKLFHGLCNDGFATVIGIFRILMAASILLIIQLGIGVDICCFHPGDKSRWLTEEEKAAKVVGAQAGPAGSINGDGTFQQANPSGVPKKSGTGTHV
jgi:hypothetical protein